MTDHEPEIELGRRDVAGAHQPAAYGSWLAWALALLIAGWFAWIVITNPNFEWAVVLQWFTAASILRGLSVTLGLTAVAMLIGIALGLLLAVARLSANRLLRTGSGLYIWFFRGTPLLVQLLFWLQSLDAVPDGRDWHSVRSAARYLENQRPYHADHRRHRRTGIERGGIHGRNHPRRAELGSARPVRDDAGIRA